MALSEFVIEDFLGEARGRYTEQFKDKKVFDKYIRLLLSGRERLQEVLRQLQQQRSIDTAVGAQLDVIGEIVGRPRGLVTSEIFKYFGFQGKENAGTFGSATDPTVGAPWYSEGGALGLSREPSDEEYRLILKAKIIKNRTLSRPEDIISAYKFLFNSGAVYIDEFEPCKVRINIGKILSTVEKGLLFNLNGAGTLLPKTVGVQYSYTEFQEGRVFATDGFPGGMGTGDLNNPAAGGFLTNLLT
ncbi:DUF2612 domain-containing protein [Pseudomonas helleri]|uniref:DUF2612 domain-containing protein n=1 Tax=Pseudomonas helleri TaxID=1608996 RepID=UPI00242DEB7C|nr:DUF2612 domain-containing protein [Pseudomonas helleri]